MAHNDWKYFSLPVGLRMYKKPEHPRKCAKALLTHWIQAALSNGRSNSWSQKGAVRKITVPYLISFWWVVTGSLAVQEHTIYTISRQNSLPCARFNFLTREKRLGSLEMRQASGRNKWLPEQPCFSAVQKLGFHISTLSFCHSQEPRWNLMVGKSTSFFSHILEVGQKS